MSIQNDFPLSEIFWYKIGGRARHLLEVEDAEDLQRALDFIDKNNQERVLICGLGSNLIFSDDYFDGTVIRLVNGGAKDSDFKREGELVSVFSGIILDDLIQYSFKHNLRGIEWAGGLPGTVGAAIRGNVGAFRNEIKDSIFSVEVLERQGTKHVLYSLKRDDLHFSYRNSLIKENRNMIIVSATFKLQPSDAKGMDEAKDTYMKNIAYRQDHHPMQYPTCGSVFKNISDRKEVEMVVNKWPDIKESVETKWYGKVSMGYIINRLGFTGYKIGKMQVSNKHANFIVNLGDGKGSDVLRIIKEIQDKVQETFGFIPEVEVEIVA